jgi:CDP-diacylglycerol pyrophosphatase
MRTASWLPLVGLLLGPVAAQAADPSILWKIVDGKCVPHQEADHNPAPCASVDLEGGVAKGYAALKDINGIAQYLLIPTARIGGIEDPAILAPGATNYWDAAWQDRHLVEERLHTALPRDAVSLAINSAYGRSQDQLHIHIDCVRQDVHDILAANLDKITDTWTPFPIPLAGHHYRSIRIGHATLDGVDPFRVLADAGLETSADMGKHTLVLIGATFPDSAEGFVLLDDHVDMLAGDFASGEQLQDHSCAVASK